ncbi:hypothetical protein [Rufibacter latericius]|uniref:Glycosyltransferase RgtA/B/C/D-like domain-containing protein n=1 Tax=Rufibacter latericius TaxID=2487040 RepID=A0A3M9MNC6_9BACT|nr:hypothetical protein [Rufibacter latericius]RNI27019.1 hypothetical protein EFB08_11190 [Rufibacter latericius]
MPLAASLRTALPVVLPFMGLMVGLTWYVQDTGFFWDSILLASKYGQWYYQTRFSTLFVPDQIGGYPPLFGMYVAAGWHLFGKTVPVSHFLMLPFLLGIVWQVYLLARQFLPKSWYFLGMLLIFLDPTLLAQSAQVAPDIALLFLYLTCLNALLQHRPVLLAVALAFLAVHTPRSQIMLAAVFLTHLLLVRQQGSLNLPKFLRLLLPYVPAGLLLVSWLVLHYQHFGWIGYAPSSDWSAYSSVVSVKGFAQNLAFIAWRLLDFGRVALWLTVAILLWCFRHGFRKETLKLMVLLVVPLVILSLVLVWYTNPIGHRYWLVVYVLLGLLTAHLLALVQVKRVQQTVYVVLVLSLLSGHFWVYPQRIAKGWDASLAYLPYFNLRKQMMTYLDEHQIPWQQVGSDFPNLASPAVTDLSLDQRQFAPKDLNNQSYILYSNVFNGFTDQELAQLQNHWVPVHVLRKGQVYFCLYRKPSTALPSVR